MNTNTNTPALKVVPSTDELAEIIRRVDGKHSLGAGALAEAIIAALPAPLCGYDVQRAEQRGAESVPAQAVASVPKGFALVPTRLTRAMSDVMDEDGWQWHELLAVADAITEQEYAELEAPVQDVAPTDAERTLKNAADALDAASNHLCGLPITASIETLPDVLSQVADRVRALLAAPHVGAQAFQQRVQPWMIECFGAQIAADSKERNHRFLEEALELVQACGCSASEAHQLVDYVFGREVGEPAQEAGGVMVTLAALCLANGLDMHAAGETELARIWTKVDAIRAKQAAKPKHSPLPQAVQGSWYECCMDGSPCRGCDRRGSAVVLAAQPAAQPADAQDAARYRHIRDVRELDQWIWDALEYQVGESADDYRRALDTAVDAAIAAHAQAATIPTEGS